MLKRFVEESGFVSNDNEMQREEFRLDEKVSACRTTADEMALALLYYAYKNYDKEVVQKELQPVRGTRWFKRVCQRAPPGTAMTKKWKVVKATKVIGIRIELVKLVNAYRRKDEEEVESREEAAAIMLDFVKNYLGDPGRPRRIRKKPKLDEDNKEEQDQEDDQEGDEEEDQEQQEQQDGDDGDSKHDHQVPKPFDIKPIKRDSDETIPTNEQFMAWIADRRANHMTSNQKKRRPHKFTFQFHNLPQWTMMRLFDSRTDDDYRETLLWFDNEEPPHTVDKQVQSFVMSAIKHIYLNRNIDNVIDRFV